jgi:FlgD Ig-like domain
VLVLVLLAGTAAAFAYTETLKSTKSPLFGTRVTKVFSPACRCPSRRAQIAFGLRRSDHLTLEIEGRGKRIVRVLVDDRATKPGRHRFVWDGRLDDGRRAPDGDYRPRVDLADADRVIRLPDPIRIDTKRPAIAPVSVRIGPRVVTVRYRVDKPARGLLYVGGTRVVLTYRRRPTGVLQVDRATLAKRGLSGVVAIGAEDLAGNRSPLHPVGTWKR